MHFNMYFYYLFQQIGQLINKIILKKSNQESNLFISFNLKKKHVKISYASSRYIIKILTAYN